MAGFKRAPNFHQLGAILSDDTPHEFQRVKMCGVFPAPPPGRDAVTVQRTLTSPLQRMGRSLGASNHLVRERCVATITE
jgi:hypothetical protein